MGTHSFSLGVHIEGIGELGGSSVDGTLFVSRSSPDYDASWSVDLWSAIPDIPDVLKERADLWKAEYRTSALEIGLVLDAEAKLPKALAPQSWTDETAAVVSDNGSTIEVQPTGQLTAGDRYFIGKEVVEFNSISSTTSTTETWNVTRAQHLTAQGSHFDGQYIYDRPPNLVERPMRVVLNKDGGTSEVIWTGLISNWGVNGAHTQIEARARALKQAFTGQKLNEQAQPIDHSGSPVEPGISVHIDVPDRRWDIDGVPTDFPFTFGDDADVPSTLTDGVIAIQAGGRVILCDVIKREDSYTIRSASVMFRREASSYDGTLPPSEQIWQVLAHHSRFSVYSYYGLGDSTSETDLPHDHVMTMALGHLTSTGRGDNDAGAYKTDVFGEDFGVGIQTSLIDVDAWVDVIRRYPNDTADQFVWGWGGESIDIWQEIKSWCRGYNYIIVPNNEGKLQPIKISDLEVTDGADISGQSAYITDNEAPLDAKGEDAVVQVSAEYGELPFVDASSESVKASGRRRRTLLRDAEATFDLTWLSQHSEAKVRQLLEDHQDKRDEHPPTLEAEMTRKHYDRAGALHGETPPLGKWVRVRGGPDRGFLGPEGDYVDPSSDQVIYTGLVTSRKMNTRTYTVTVEVLLWMWSAAVPARLVAPAIVVGTDSSAGTATGSDGTGDWVSYEGNPLQAYDGTVGLMANDDVVIERPDGLGRNAVREIDQIDTSAKRIYLKNAFPSGSVKDGHFLRLSDEQDFSNTGWNGSSYWTTSTIADRRYTYITDASGFFTSGEEADTYTGV